MISKVKTRITAIAIIFVAICCGSPKTNTNTSKPAEKENSLTDTIQKAEPNLTTAYQDALDTVYRNKILSYKDSIDRKVKTLKKISKNLEGSAEGGEAILYLAGKDTLRMNVIFYGETGKSEYAFYLSKDAPVLYIGTTTFYKEAINVSKEVRIDNIVKDEVILKNKEVISWKQNEQLSNKQKYSQKAQEIFDLYTEIEGRLGLAGTIQN